MSKAIVLVFILLALVISGYLFARPTRHKRMAQADCHAIKETCSRKKGCKCKLNCDDEGRRLPPAGGKSECPSYCCEEKCECHPMGCA